jgi:hypothetical protein
VGEGHGGGGFAHPAFLIGNANDFCGHGVAAWFQSKIKTNTAPAAMVANPSKTVRKRANITVIPEQ